MKFVPLHVYSAYSFLQSGLTIDKMISSLNKNGYSGMAICDNGVMYGIPQFISKMEKVNQPFIIGMEVNYDNNTFGLYVKNEDGYLNLVAISTSISRGDFNLDYLNSHHNGLVVILDTSKGNVKTKLNEEEELDFARFLNELSKPFECFYLGIELKSRDELDYVRKLRNFAKEHTYSCVAFPHIKYQNKNDAIILDIVEAIEHDDHLTKKEETGNQFFMSLDDYQRIYTREELENTYKILEMSNFNFHQKRGEMMHFSISQSNSLLKEKCYQALKEKGLDNKEEYIKRLDYELSVINSMGYDDYFLLVQDYVAWAKNNGIMSGVRGSAAGSLVTYLLNISVLDPIYYNLQFERFLNPSRKTMPDIDVDFMDSRRNEVIDYCRSKYGKEKVANIITFSTILAKQSLRDIGRVYDYPTRHIDLLCNTLANSSYSLRDAYRHIPAFKELVDSDKFYLEIVTLASKIEGLIRQSSLHAAGVIINEKPINESLPVIYDFSDNLISQYEMGYLEEQGFLKMDFLGITNLSVVSSCVDLINKNHKDAKLDKLNLPYDDKKVYELICSLQTMGIFQLEGAGMKGAIKILKPNSFNDIAALLALYRPGPMHEIIEYAKRKEGKKAIAPMSEEQRKILGPTYGIIVFQEQITELAVLMAKMSMAEADNFRRAISKKKKELLSSLEKTFVEGAIKNGYSVKEANDYYQRISRFDAYGFNKSHSYSYALLSCQMAYLKAYYPLEFYATILQSSSTTNDTKFNEYISEMKKRNIFILPPNINKSKMNFEIVDDGIVFPLNAIKNINSIMTQNILLEREKKPFSDFFDFVGRMYPYKISEVQIEKLIDAGAFDCFNVSRSSLRGALTSSLQYAELIYDPDGGTSLFESVQKPIITDIVDDPIENLDKEYEAIGIMLSNNPLNFMKDILEKENILTINQALELSENLVGKGPSLKIAGIVRNKKVIKTKNGSQMAFIKLFDETQEFEAIFFPEIYKNALKLTAKNTILCITGHFEVRNNEKTFIVEDVTLLEDLKNA